MNEICFVSEISATKMSTSRSRDFAHEGDLAYQQMGISLILNYMGVISRICKVKYLVDMEGAVGILL